MIRKHVSEVPDTKIDKEGFVGVTAKLALTKDDGCPRYTMRLMEFEPGGHTAMHAHAEEHEFYFLAGEPAVVDGSGKETQLRVGDFLYVSPNEPHQNQERRQHQDEDDLDYPDSSRSGREHHD